MDPSRHQDSPPSDLLRLLAIKRHEVPPPGFFDRLPNRILVNIRAGSSIPEPGPWRRLWDALIGEPMVASSYAALVMGGLLFGFSVYQTAKQADEGETFVALHPHGLPEAGYMPPTFASLPRSDAPASIIVVSQDVTPEPRFTQSMGNATPNPPYPGSVRFIPSRYDGTPVASGSLLGNLDR